MLDRALSTMADIVQGDGIAFDGKQDAVDAAAAAIEHLPEGDAKLLRFVLGDGVPLRHRRPAWRWLSRSRHTSGRRRRGTARQASGMPRRRRPWPWR